MGWSVAPETLEELLLSLHRRYGPRLPPVFITENGSAEADTPSADGRIHDADRVACLAAHTEAVARAIRTGVGVRGYYVWSLLDNFEWAHGYSERFGLVHVDYATQRRMPKARFH
ncbi:family 1 glycosylhydrolase [Streptomyces sp. NPDC049915]|uniref:family 1 glycosylhydrolase n=1 Tax=Streptomyces sp. NPDC049915 TaxID=3155510 RepID=UPI003447D7DD